MSYTGDKFDCFQCPPPSLPFFFMHDGTWEQVGGRKGGGTCIACRMKRVQCRSRCANSLTSKHTLSTAFLICNRV